MTYTEREKQIAKGLNDPDTLALLEKVLTEKYAAEEQSEKNVIALSNERYGEIMKVNFMVRQHVLNALRRIKTIAADKPVSSPAIAPR
jgi:hypothetical protein